MINGFDDDRIKALENAICELENYVASCQCMIDTLQARVEELEHRDVASIDKIKQAFGYAINYL